MNAVVVIGVGNRYREDDGVGPAVLDALSAAMVSSSARLVELDGEPARVVDAWTGAELAIVVDAQRSDRVPAGTVCRLEVGVDDGVLGASPSGAGGSHALGIGAAAALGHAVGRMPARLVVFAVEGATFGHGEALSEPVRRAVADVSASIRDEIGGTG